jgi:hypothetical protein
MKKLVLASATALIVWTTQAIAQEVRVEIAPPERARIKEYIVKEKVPRATVRERVRVGGDVPRDVELREVPETWGPSVRRYRYYHSEHGVHFVDPENRRMIYEMED